VQAASPDKIDSGPESDHFAPAPAAQNHRRQDDDFTMRNQQEFTDAATAPRAS
jgi:hypothetical protein